MTTTSAIDTSAIVLRHGAHQNRDEGMCAMEAVAFLANEAHSDHPQCACHIVSSAVRRLNDRINNDALRTELLMPLLPKLLKSRTASIEVMRKRAFVAADWAVRVFAPIALRARGREEDAAKLEAARPICDKETAEAGRRYAADAAAAAYAAYADDAYAAAAAADAAAAAADAAAYAAYADDAYAYAAAADAAAAAAADAAAAAARRLVYAKGVEMIEAMLAVRE